MLNGLTNVINKRRELVPSDVYQTPFIIYNSGTTMVAGIKISVTIIVSGHLETLHLTGITAHTENPTS